MLSLNEQQVYNAWLRSFRTHQNQPFRARAKWDNFPETLEPFAVKLATFFQRHPHIDQTCFFEAPYLVYTHDKSTKYQLEFYCSQKAIGLYTTYLKMLKLSPPDSPRHLKWMQQSFAYIIRFCLANKIALRDYGTSFEGSLIAPFVQHIKDAKVSIYVMFAFPDAFQYLQSLERDLIEMMLGDIDIHATKREYLSSKQARSFCEHAYKAAEQYVTTKENH
jgi:hypothetical protein